MNWRRFYAVFGVFVLALVPVSAKPSLVSGTASYRETITLPTEAVFEARLLDITLADTLPVELGRVSIAGPGGPSIRFTIPFDPNSILEDHVYSVRATVEVAGRLRFTSDTIYPVLTGGASDHVDVGMVMLAVRNGDLLGLRGETGIFVAQASGTAVDATPEAAMTGQGEATDAAVPKPEREPSMQGLVTYAADGASFQQCSSGMTYPISEEGDYAALEHAYLAAGREPGLSIFATFDGDLEQRPGTDGSGDEKDVVVVNRFIGVWPDVSCDRATREVGLTNTYWKILKLGETEIQVPEGGKDPHLILLGDDEDRFTATVGCNQILGSYSVDGDAISFGKGAASTQMACLPPLDGWERLLADTILQARRWTISGDKMCLVDETGAVIAEFQAVSLN